MLSVHRGRLLDLAKQKLMGLSNVTFMALDEADEMLDLGFLPDVEKTVFTNTSSTSDNAVLGHHARGNLEPGSSLPKPPDPHPGQ